MLGDLGGRDALGKLLFDVRDRPRRLADLSLRFRGDALSLDEQFARGVYFIGEQLVAECEFVIVAVRIGRRGRLPTFGGPAR